MTAATKAWELRSKLFALVGEFKDFQQAVWDADTAEAGTDAKVEAAGQADAAACALAGVHAALGGLFTDAAQDRPEFGIELARN